jgi:hypothetical protein
MGWVLSSSFRLGVWVAAIVIVRCCWCRIRAGRVAAIGVADGARCHAARNGVAYLDASYSARQFLKKRLAASHV